MLLTSLLGFWRVKRWERGIIASRESAAASAPPRTNPGLLGSSFGFPGLSRADLYQGFGFGTRRPSDEANSSLVAGEDGSAHHLSEETQPMIRSNSVDPQRNRAIVREERLQRDLQEAGLL